MHTLLELWVTKTVLVKVGGSLGRGPAIEVTHLGLNQPPIFSSVKSLNEIEKRILFWSDQTSQIYSCNACNQRPQWV